MAITEQTAPSPSRKRAVWAGIGAAFIQFGLQFLLPFFEELLSPASYGETGKMIFFLYPVALFFGLLTIPFFSSWAATQKGSIRRFLVFVFYFALVLLIINGITFATMRVIYTVELLQDVLPGRFYMVPARLELVNLFISFCASALFLNRGTRRPALRASAAPLEKVSESLSLDTRRAIGIFAGMDGHATDQQILQIFRANGISAYDAALLLIMLPVSFCRRLVPEMRGKDEYMEVRGPHAPFVKKKFSKSASYTIIDLATAEYFASSPAPEVMLKIAGRSAEFHLVNQALLAGHSVDQLELTPMVVLLPPPDLE